MFRFSLRELFVAVTCLCFALGMFWVGRGFGRREAWDEACDHQRVMLHLYAKMEGDFWTKDLREMAASDTGVTIIGSGPCERAADHRWFVERNLPRP